MGGHRSIPEHKILLGKGRETIHIFLHFSYNLFYFLHLFFPQRNCKEEDRHLRNAEFFCKGEKARTAFCVFPNKFLRRKRSAVHVVCTDPVATAINKKPTIKGRAGPALKTMKKHIGHEEKCGGIDFCQIWFHYKLLGFFVVVVVMVLCVCFVLFVFNSAIITMITK